MLRISNVRPLEGRVVQLTLTDGSVVERDLSALLDGVGVFARISLDDAAFREGYVDYGTLVWPGDVDIAPETLIWDGRTRRARLVARRTSCDPGSHSTPGQGD